MGVPTGGGHGKARLCSPEHLAEYAAAILGQGQAGQGYGERRLKEAPDGQARRICTTERLRPMRFHSLRYTAATLLMAKGAPVTTATFPLRSGRSQPVSPCA